MSIMHRARRSTQGNRPGYIMWSLLDGSSALQVPWADLIPHGGRVDFERLRDIRERLDRFERAFESQDSPELPTPHALVVQVDSSDFERELADRLQAYRGRLG